MVKIIVMGEGQHGKGTFCKLATAHFGLTAVSSSRFACDAFLFEQLRETLGYPDADSCFEDRHQHRALWYQAIAQYNTPELSRLGRDIFAKHDIYDGIRSLDELNALREAGLFDLAIWIDASERMPREPASSITVSKANADIIIENNGTEADYETKVIRLLQALTRINPDHH